jgi:uncharacterized SAM-binding protein YcdF (DUF218 family)
VLRFLRRFPWLLAAAIVLAVGFATYPYWLAALGGYLVSSENPVFADTIVVLAGDFTGNRIIVSAKMVKQGFAQNAIVSGPAGIYGLYECDLAIPMAVRQGYPASYFVRFPNDSKSTASEAEAIVQELRKLHVHKIDLVTSNFHTRRAGRIFRRIAPNIETHVVAAPDPYFTPDGWWKQREGRKTFLLEWTKTVASWLGM